MLQDPHQPVLFQRRHPTRLAVALLLLLLAAAASPATARQSEEEARQLMSKAADLWVAKSLPQAEEAYGKAIAGWQAVGDERMTAFAIASRAAIRLQRGRLREALADAQRSDEMLRTMIDRLPASASAQQGPNSDRAVLERNRVMALSTMRDVAVAERRYAAARGFQEAEIEIFRRLNDENPAGLASCYEGLGEIDLLEGRTAEAARHYDQSAAFWARSQAVYASDYVADRLKATRAAAQDARRRAGIAGGSTESTVAAATDAAPEESDETSAPEPSGDEPTEAELAAVSADDEPAADTDMAPAGDEPSAGPAAAGPSVETRLRELVETIARIVSSLPGGTVRLIIFGLAVLFVLRRAQRAALNKARRGATSASRSSRPTPPRPRPSAASNAPPPLPPGAPPVADLGGVGQSPAVAVQGARGWCGCIALIVVGAGIAALVVWLRGMLGS